MAEPLHDHRPVSWAHRLVCVLGLILILFSVYGVIGARQVGAELHTLETAIDRAIPFNYAWVLSYGPLYRVDVELARALHRAQAQAPALDRLDLGGGLGPRPSFGFGTARTGSTSLRVRCPGAAPNSCRSPSEAP